MERGLAPAVTSSSRKLSRSQPTTPAELPSGFPAVIVTAEWGRWWRVHRACHDAWWFASSDGSDGRFDLPKSCGGTCYVSCDPEGGGVEHLRAITENHARSQRVTNGRVVSPMPLDRWYDKKIADFTSAAVQLHGAPVAIEDVAHDESRAWALAAYRGGFGGILYRLRRDRSRNRYGLALFGTAGQWPPDNAQDPLFLVVRLRKEMAQLAGGYPDDPLAV